MQRENYFFQIQNQKKHKLILIYIKKLKKSLKKYKNLKMIHILM